MVTVVGLLVVVVGVVVVVVVEVVVVVVGRLVVVVVVVEVVALVVRGTVVVVVVVEVVGGEGTGACRGGDQGSRRSCCRLLSTSYHSNLLGSTVLAGVVVLSVTRSGILVGHLLSISAGLGGVLSAGREGVLSGGLRGGGRGGSSRAGTGNSLLQWGMFGSSVTFLKRACHQLKIAVFAPQNRVNQMKMMSGQGLPPSSPAVLMAKCI